MEGEGVILGHPSAARGREARFDTSAPGFHPWEAPHAKERGRSLVQARFGLSRV